MADESEENEALSASASADGDTEPEFSLVCQPCQEDKETAEAEGFCQECKVYLCNQCIRWHKKLPALREHTLLDKNAVPKDTDIKVTTALDVCTEQCIEHEGEIVKYFCPNHACLGCSVCITLEHRTCNIIYIPKNAKNMEINQEFIDFQKKIKQLVEKSTDLEARAETSKERVQSVNTQAVQNVAEYKHVLIEVLETLQKSIQQKVEEIKEKDMAKMSTISEKSKKMKEELKSLSTKFEALIKKNQYCKLFIDVKKANSRVKEIETELIAHEAETVAEYRFEKTDLHVIIKHIEETDKLKTRRNPKDLQCVQEDDITIRVYGDARNCDIISSIVICDQKWLLPTRIQEIINSK